MDVPPPEPPWRRELAASVRRLIGVVLIVAVTSIFFLLVDLSRLDTVRDDVSIATAVDVARSGVPADQVSNCFQGFCFEDDVGFLQRWWEFSSTYLRFVWPGLLLAFVIAGIVDGFLLPTRGGPGYGSWATALPESRRHLGATSVIRPSGRSGLATALLVGGMGGPALAMTAILFTPAVWMTRVGLALLIALPLIGWRTAASREEPVTAASLADAVYHSGRAALRFGYRLLPLFVLAAFIGGIGTQYLTLEGVESVAGGHVLGVLVAAVTGLLLDLPLTFGLPLAALALLVGVDPIVTGVFLVTATLTGPRALARGMRHAADRRIGSVAVALSVVGAVAAFGVGEFALAATGGPTITWDGEACSYRGPTRFGPGVHAFSIRNETEDLGEGHTMAVVVGKLPPNVSFDHFDATVAADRTAPLPSWFTVAGTEEFIFPGTEVDTEITFHDPGVYAAVCLDGGGFYVIFEFSMPQPMGWFDEFRSTFDGHVAEQTFTVAG